MTQLLGVHGALASDLQAGTLARAIPGSETPAASGVSNPASDVTIYVVTNATHSDLVIPRAAFSQAPPRIKAVVDKLDGGSWILVGWGPYWFGRSERGGPYHAAPWLMANAAVTLVVPQLRSRVRFVALLAPGPPPRENYNSLTPVRMSALGLEKAIERIDASFETGPDGRPILSDLTGAAPGVLIYRSKEIYHATHECNHWVAEVLNAGGVNTPSILALTPGVLKLDLQVTGAQAGPRIALQPGAGSDARVDQRQTPSD